MANEDTNTQNTGETGSSSTDQNQNNNTGAGTDGNTDETNTGGTEDEKLFSQADLNAMTQNRLKRQEKKFNERLTALEKENTALKLQVGSSQGTQQGQGQQGNGQQGQQGQQDVVAQVLAVLQATGVIKADTQTSGKDTKPSKTSAINARVLRSDAKIYALSQGVDAKDVDDLILMSDLGSIEVDDDGEYDIFDLQKQIKTTIARRPDLFKKGAPPTNIGSGNNKKPADKKTTVRSWVDEQYQKK